MYRIIMNFEYYFRNLSGGISLVLGLVLATAVFSFVVGPLHNLIKAKVIKLCGDDWVEDAGYVSMDISNSFHWIGTFSAFLVFMGFTKRVRYRQRYLHAPVVSSFLVSLTGIITYLVCFFVFCFLYSFFVNLNLYGIVNPSSMPAQPLPLLGCVYHTFLSTLFFLIRICLYSAFFNLIPIAPMDMGEVLFAFLGQHWSDMIKKNDMIISVVLFLLAFLALGMPDSFLVKYSLQMINFFNGVFVSFFSSFI